jgi:indolepyruvate ferredoxin oxidoreductase
MAVPAEKIDLSYTLDDKYTREKGRVYLSGVQALVRLPMMQHLRDQAAGLNTGGFISGYRGSPLGGLDQNLWRARNHLANNGIEFVSGLNEDLAATAVWGSQQVNLFPGAQVDGVFAMWYGKGPGVDRCGDVFKHGNAAGSSRHGGVLVLAGDDHACRSSTLPHQSEHEFISALMPILNPAGVQDILDMGLMGWAMSRFTGRWVGFKTIAETVESSASVMVDPHQMDIVIPDEMALPEGGLNIRWPDPPMDQELRMHRFALHAARAFARANQIDRITIDSPRARLGIATSGKSYLDVLQALQGLGIDPQMAADIGIRVYKIGMTWPLEREGVRRFAQGLEDILVVEEKRSFIEKQIKEQLYNWDAGARPSIVGKYDEDGEWILPSTGELTPAQVARVIARRLSRFFTAESITERLAFLDRKERQLESPRVNFPRTPHFCSGCPHNSSTRVPEGSRAMAGIGCHYMTVWMDRDTDTFTQMGGEGVPWIGQSAFTDTEHVFVNLGDGTYFHSGALAVRACVAAKVNITFKILYNDAVAMTGGQPVDGSLSVIDIAKQVSAEGVQTIVVMSDEPEKWSGDPKWFPKGVQFHHRDELDLVQRELRETTGVSVLIYDQTCAAELRRRRKRKLVVDPPKRTFINAAVCEGCGDCGIQSNCLSILPKETEFGRKRAIDQSSCNKDFSCIKGFCPSFVTVHGGSLKKRQGSQTDPGFEALKAPELPTLERPFDMLITGVGGTGVVTIGALLGMAAHLEGRGVTVLDQTGLAQKGGAVTSHIRIGKKPEDLYAVRIAAGSANLVLGCDNVVAVDEHSLAKMQHGLTRAVINTNQAMPGTFSRNKDLKFPLTGIEQSIRDAVGDDALDLVDASRLATALMGDSIATNLFMLGFAWQRGLIPVGQQALERAIELNGVAVEANLRAFAWGRMTVVDPQAVVDAAGGENAAEPLAESLEEIIAVRKTFLTGYQDAAYAERYEGLVREVAQAEKDRAPGATGLAEAVARYYFKLLAYKDEYEVARLFTDGQFEQQIDAVFEGDYKIHFNLAAPVFARRDALTGHLRKAEFGRWMFSAFKLLARLKRLRGGILDPFGYTAERRAERQLIVEYEVAMAEIIAGLDSDRHGLAVEWASIPDHIRGYGHVKAQSLIEAGKLSADLIERFRFDGEERGAA